MCLLSSQGAIGIFPSSREYQTKLPAAYEEGTLSRLKHLRNDILQPRIDAHHGRIFKAVGDGFLAEFPSPEEAVRCAIGVQEALTAEAAQDPSSALSLRIGVNLGDIIVEE